MTAQAGGLLTSAACEGHAAGTEPLAQAWLEQWPLRWRPGKRAQILGTLGNLRDIEVYPALAASGTVFPFRPEAIRPVIPVYALPVPSVPL